MTGVPPNSTPGGRGREVADASFLAAAASELAGIEFGNRHREGTALRLEIGTLHLGHDGFVDAGALFTFADTASACDTTRAVRACCTTAEAKISYLAPVTEGALSPPSRILTASRGLVAATVSIHCDEVHGAQAVFTFAMLP